MLIEGYALGFLATTSLVAALFFLRFWVRTHDFLFLAFAVAFGVEAVSRTAMALMNLPDGSSWIYIVRLCTYLLILVAILRKNRLLR